MLWGHTLRQLCRPHRLVPIVALAVPLVVTQHSFSVDKVLGGAISVLLVLGFVLMGPWSWRAARRSGALGFALWPLVGLLPFGIGYAMSQVVEASPTYLLSSTTGALSAALYLVGSWGLGRDIELESGLAQMTKRAETLQTQARSAQILALQAHLDPHFLFNTLNAIAEWCVVDGERAEQAVLDLAVVLRRINEGVLVERWSLREELDLARQVLDLHAARDPDGVRVQVQTGSFGATVPPLLLLPLVENAITHGPGAGHHGTIVVKVVEGEEMQVSVRNPGAFNGPREGGQGLAMVSDRLALFWGDRARLEIGSEGNETVALLRWPRD